MKRRAKDGSEKYIARWTRYSYKRTLSSHIEMVDMASGEQDGALNRQGR